MDLSKYTTVEMLIDEYKKKHTHKEQADIEEKIWEMVHKPGDKVERRDILKEALKINSRTSELHSVLLRAESLADPLWPMLDENKISIGTAREVLHLTRQKWKTNRSQSITEVRDFVLGYMLEHPELSLARLYQCILGSQKTAPIGNVEWKEEGDFWKTLKVNLNGHLEEELSHLSTLTSSVVRAKVESIFREAIIEARTLVYRESKRGKEGKGLESFLAGNNAIMEEVENACHLLGISAPESGCPVDMNKAKQRKRALALSLSTDRNAVGADVNSVKYKLLTEKHMAVNAAFQIIEQYNASLTS